MAKDRILWKDLRETYVQQWTGKADYNGNDDDNGSYGVSNASL